MATQHVTLVATEAMIQQYHPSARRPHVSAKPGIMSAEFPVDPAACQTKLGAWLAGTIHTTRFDDDLSQCRIVLPATEFGLHVRDLAERLRACQQVHTLDQTELVFQLLADWTEQQRKSLKVYERHAFTYRTTHFEWPVFGSARAGGAATPEAYFDECAGQIRKTGGVIIDAGMRDVPPSSLIESMANGRGSQLLRAYEKQKITLWPARSTQDAQEAPCQ